MKDNKLYIPQGIKNKREYFDGYGKRELELTIIVTVISLIIDLGYYTLTNNLMTSVLFILISFATTILFVTKDISNISVVDQVGFIIRFAKSQKVYNYVARDEWRL